MKVDRKDATGREAMSLLADSLELNDDPIVRRFVRAVRCAEIAPKSDGNRAYNTEFLVWMGLAQSERGRPRKDVMPHDLLLYLRRRPNVSETSLKFVLAKALGVSPATVRTRIKEAKQQLAVESAERSAKVAEHSALLTGATAVEGHAKMSAIVAANGLASDIDLMDLNSSPLRI